MCHKSNIKLVKSTPISRLKIKNEDPTLSSKISRTLDLGFPFNFLEECKVD